MIIAAVLGLIVGLIIGAMHEYNTVRHLRRHFENEIDRLHEVMRQTPPF